MDQQGKYTKAEILDLSEYCQDFDCDSSTWLSSAQDTQKVKAIENHTRERRDMQNKNIPVSAEEVKIRSELGMKIERDLEEEIKEGIYHLALRLHRIFQQRKERDVKEASEPGNNRSSTLSEVNISIRMEGGTKIEIKEVNKERGEKGYCPCPPRTYKPKNNVKEVRKFDWAKSLRKGSSPVAVNRSYVSSKHKEDRMLKGKNNAGSFGQANKNASADKKLLQLGWKV
ncbi:hypothetical protein SESBI_30294 [Sesbania bispinosa]|nr:hypothetical protein SESBI_30294 [Sesbania bispinosa]